jgi:hypothetical protein
MFTLLNLEIWDIEDKNMQKFKIMMNLYRDNGIEFSGELEIYKLERKLIYSLYNDRNKKTVAYLSKDRYLKAKDRKSRIQEKINTS